MTNPRKPKRQSQSTCSKLEYFKILDSEALPKIINNSLNHSYQHTPSKLVQKIVKSDHFIYIDFDEDLGCKIMKRATPTHHRQQLSKIGNNYIFNLKNLSKRNQLTLDYLSKQQQTQQYKTSIRKLLKYQIDHSLQKLNKKKLYKFNYQEFSEKRKLQFDPNKLKQLVDNSQLDALNQSIWIKEKQLIEKLGINCKYMSKSVDKDKDKDRENRESKTKVKIKLFPSINYRSINS